MEQEYNGPTDEQIMARCCELLDKTRDTIEFTIGREFDNHDEADFDVVGELIEARKNVIAVRVVLGLDETHNSKDNSADSVID